MAATTQFLKSATALNPGVRIPMNKVIGMESREINPTQGTGNNTVYQIAFKIENGSSAPSEMVLNYASSALRDAALADFDTKLTVAIV